MFFYAALLCVNATFAGDLLEIRPTPEGVVSIHAGDADHCSDSCGGDWSGSACADLPGAVVWLYAGADTPAKRRHARPVVSTVVDAEGFADIPALPLGTYQWEVSAPGRQTERGEVAVGQPLPAPAKGNSPPGQDYPVRIPGHRSLKAGERPAGTWFDVRLRRPGTGDGLATQATTYSADELARLPMR